MRFALEKDPRSTGIPSTKGVSVMIAIIDYGMGNLRSVQKALEYLGFDARVTDSRNDLIDASHIILPGVGAFADAIGCLNRSGMRQTMLDEIAKGKPFLGICLGMQLLFDKSFENGEYAGLSLVPGDVVPFNVAGLKVPHMGWNNLVARNNALFDAGDGQYVYFVHSYHAAGRAGRVYHCGGGLRIPLHRGSMQR